jgi:hypothetical protein
MQRRRTRKGEALARLAARAKRRRRCAGAQTQTDTFIAGTHALCLLRNSGRRDCWPASYRPNGSRRQAEHMTSASAQTEKNSVRAYVFRFCPRHRTLLDEVGTSQLCQQATSSATRAREIDARPVNSGQFRRYSAVSATRGEEIHHIMLLD